MVQQLSVALLLEKTNVAKEISLIFRKIGIIPSLFLELSEVLSVLDTNPPALLIIDIKKLTDGERYLKNHPLIEKQMIPTVFFYEEKNAPLLVTSYEYFNYGAIKEGESYEKALKIILGRINKVRALTFQLEQMQEQLQLSEKKISEYEAQLKQIQENEKGRSMIWDYLLQKFQTVKTKEQFPSLIADLFNCWKEVETFSCLMIDKKGGALISPSLMSSSSKFTSMPIIQLGQVSRVGIEFFAQNMAIEVAIDILGEEALPVPVYGKEENPDYLIFLRPLPGQREFFPWKHLSTVLSGHYLRLQNGLGGTQTSSSENYTSLRPWQLFSLMDHNPGHGKITSSKTFIDLDFTPLLEFIKANSHIPFYWNHFIEDFIKVFYLQSSESFEICFMGVHHLLFVIDNRITQNFMTMLQGFINDFTYTSYFEETYFHLSESCFPVISKVPPSTESYLKILEGASENIQEL